MQEARLSLPQTDNEGRTLVIETDRVMVRLSEAFGGVTLSQGFGFWIDPNTNEKHSEPVSLLDVAMIPSELNDRLLRRIAVDFGEVAKQKAVYVRYASGKVEIIDIAKATASAA